MLLKTKLRSGFANAFHVDYANYTLYKKGLSKYGNTFCYIFQKLSNTAFMVES